jgi:hypothetical protein
MKSFKKPKEVTKSSTSNTMVKRKKCEKTNNNPKTSRLGNTNPTQNSGNIQVLWKGMKFVRH